MSTPEPCSPIFQDDPRRLLCACHNIPFDPAELGTGWAAHVRERAEARWPVDLSAHHLAAFMSPHGSPDGPGWVASADCACGEQHPGSSLDSPQEAAARALADWAAHVWFVGMLGDAPLHQATPSCSTCACTDTAVRDGEAIMECHLLPPMTMPPAPALPLPEAAVYIEGDEPVEMEVAAFAAPHRYPVVTSDDWCSHYRPQEADDGR